MMHMDHSTRPFTLPLLLLVCLTGLAATVTLANRASAIAPGASPAKNLAANACPVAEPDWLTWPEDSAIPQAPQPGYFIVNPHRSMWASAWWWAEGKEYHLHAGEDGNKVGWFRPAGATLEITGQRLDAEAPALQAEVPCCYPSRFQATGLYFPTEGCWQITARAGGSVLKFVVEVEPLVSPPGRRER
jgi:hypothetical protein